MALMLGLLLIANGCGGSGLSTNNAKPKRLSQAGELTVSASIGHETSFPLLVDYAIAGLTTCNKLATDKGSLVVFAAFRDGQINSQLDLSTLSLSIDMAELSNAKGTALFDFQLNPIPIYLEAWEEGTSRLIALEAGKFTGGLELQVPPLLAPGSTLEGSLSLAIPDIGIQSLAGQQFTLDGFFQVPVFGNCK